MQIVKIHGQKAGRKLLINVFTDTPLTVEGKQATTAAITAEILPIQPELAPEWCQVAYNEIEAYAPTREKDIFDTANPASAYAGLLVIIPCAYPPAAGKREEIREKLIAVNKDRHLPQVAVLYVSHHAKLQIVQPYAS